MPGFLLRNQVQKHAASAVKWLEKRGGRIEGKDLVGKLSKIGTAGAHLNNAERDMHRLLDKVSLSFSATPEDKLVRMVNPSTLEIDWQPLPILFPDTFLTGLWEAGEDIFRRCLFGELTEKETCKVWEHISKTCPWFSTHPASTWHCKEKVASIGTYGDEIQCYRNSECGVVSVAAWTAEFAVNSQPLLRYFPLAVWSEHCECKFTYSDLESHLVDRWRSLSDPAVSWPWTSSGYLMAFSFAQGDLKWINSRMGGMHNYRRNDFCSRCCCVKTDADLRKTLPHFPLDPDGHEARNHSPEQLLAFSSLFALPGMCLERVQHDIVHSQYLGTGKTTNGAVLIYLCESGLWGQVSQTPGLYADRLAVALRRAHRDFLLFKKMQRLSCSQPRFTPARLNRKVRTSFMATASSQCFRLAFFGG